MIDSNVQHLIGTQLGVTTLVNYVNDVHGDGGVDIFPSSVDFTQVANKLVSVCRIFANGSDTNSAQLLKKYLQLVCRSDVGRTYTLEKSTCCESNEKSITFVASVASVSHPFSNAFSSISNGMSRGAAAPAKSSSITTTSAPVVTPPPPPPPRDGRPLMVLARTSQTCGSVTVAAS